MKGALDTRSESELQCLIVTGASKKLYSAVVIRMSKEHRCPQCGVMYEEFEECICLDFVPQVRSPNSPWTAGSGHCGDIAPMEPGRWDIARSSASYVSFETSQQTERR